MGVTGLWRLLDATGKSVSLQTLEGTVLSIDISIWIHQVIQGYQDRQGNPIPNAHLIGLFNRICKLIYFKIKPVFVFDGGVPLLKKNTIALRRKLKSIATTKARKLKNDLINNLIKHSVVKGALDKGIDGESCTKQQFKDLMDCTKTDDMYVLTSIPSTSKLIDSDDCIDSDEDYKLEHNSPRKQAKWIGNIHNVDVNNEEFKNLPADVRYDILTDLKETRKQNSWGRMHELPVGSNNYSGFQVKRLLKRRFVQESLEIAEKEMGGKTLTLEELNRLLTDQGIRTTQNDEMFRIASDNRTRVIYLNDKPVSKNTAEVSDLNNLNINKSKETDFDSKDIISIKSDNSVAVIDDMGAYNFHEDWYSDESFYKTILNDSQALPRSNFSKSEINSNLSYMLEHSGFTQDEITNLINQSKKKKMHFNGKSSQGSSKRGRTKNCQFLRNKVKKKEFDSSKIETEIANSIEASSESDHEHDSQKFNNETDEIKSNNSKTETIMESSNSECDDFVEVLEQFNIENQKIINTNKTINIETPNFQFNDFVEIKDVFIPELVDLKKLQINNFQIKFKADEDLKDDIFVDVFGYNDDEAVINKERKKKLDDSQENILFKNNFPIKLIQKDNVVVDKDEINKDDSYQLKKKNKYQTIICDFESEKNFYSDEETLKCEIKNTNEILLNMEDSKKAIVPRKKFDTEEFQFHTNHSQDSFALDVGNSDKSKNVEQIKNEKTEIENNSEVKKVSKVCDSILFIDESQIESMKKQLEIDQNQISGKLGKLQRQATDVTDQMRTEAQELLQLFGIPYITAPMEAEAQCAYLEQIKLTDGTITDDSDIWLFGGHCVYKNFFDSNKKVLKFLSNDIKHHFKLSRKEMIQLALLVGSDYTRGLSGIGPVTALEILAAFPSEGEDILRGLRAFASWFKAGKLAAPGKTTLRNKLKNIQIEKGFPSQAVAQAYMCPVIDESKEAFTWGKPNLTLLADYVSQKFGWTKLKFEETITPVMKKLTESKSQKGLEFYFKMHSVPKSIEATLSKRVQTAVQTLGISNKDIEVFDDEASAKTLQKITNIRKLAFKKEKKYIEGSTELLPLREMNEDVNKKEAIQETAEKLNDTMNKKKLKKIINVIEDIIPQREQDKANALKLKLRAIEIFRKSKKGLNRVKKTKKVVKKVKEDADLSESSSSS